MPVLKKQPDQFSALISLLESQAKKQDERATAQEDKIENLSKGLQGTMALVSKLSQAFVQSTAGANPLACPDIADADVVMNDDLDDATSEGGSVTPRSPIKEDESRKAVDAAKADEQPAAKTVAEQFWEEAQSEYTPVPLYGTECDSAVTQTAKTFFTTDLAEDRLKERREKHKVPANCTFLTPKRCNPQVFAMLPPPTRALESGIQEALEIQSRSATATFKAAEALAEMLSGLEEARQGTPEAQLAFVANLDLRGPLTNLRDSMSLEGVAHRKFDAVRRKAIKPNVPAHMSKHFDPEPEDPSLLFCKALNDEAEKVVEKRKSAKGSGAGKSKDSTESASKKPYAKKKGSGASGFQGGYGKAWPNPPKTQQQQQGLQMQFPNFGNYMQQLQNLQTLPQFQVPQLGAAMFSPNPQFSFGGGQKPKRGGFGGKKNKGN
jgi:hypothetical protein